jgi:uncharacterized protein YraI
MSGAAMAASAVSTGNVNVRSGPSAQYERINTLRRGQAVEVTGCRGGWCYVETRGNDGWVSASYLRADRQRSSSQPAISFSFNFGSPPVARPPRQHGGNNGGWNNNGPYRGNDPDWDQPHNGGKSNGSQSGSWNNGPRFLFGN